MMNKLKMVKIPRYEYIKLKRIERLDRELLHDISNGIKDILNGKIKEV